MFALFPIPNDFLSSLRECEGASHTAHTWELLLGVVSHLIILAFPSVSGEMSACPLGSPVLFSSVQFLYAVYKPLF